jgi:hypothetical protein
MSWVAAATAGSAVLGYASSQNAAGAQGDSAAEASAMNWKTYLQQREDLDPWRLQGKTSLAQLGDMTKDQNSSLLKPFDMNDFQASPAYQFNLSEGQKAIDKGAAARGRYYAPATLQDIGKYSQGLASNEFQNAFNNYNTGKTNIWNRLNSLSGQGQNAAAQTGAFGSNAGNQMAANTIGAGNAAAAGQIGGANALAGAANSYANNQLFSSYLQNQQRSSVPEAAPGQFSVFNPQYG